MFSSCRLFNNRLEFALGLATEPFHSESNLAKRVNAQPRPSVKEDVRQTVSTI